MDYCDYTINSKRSGSSPDSLEWLGKDTGGSIPPEHSGYPICCCFMLRKKLIGEILHLDIICVKAGVSYIWNLNGLQHWMLKTSAFSAWLAIIELHALMALLNWVKLEQWSAMAMLNTRLLSEGKRCLFLVILSICQGCFQEALGTSPMFSGIFLNNKYEEECLVLWINFKKELSNWEAEIIWSEYVLWLWICIFRATQKPWNSLPWNVARHIYTWAMKRHNFRNACELRFWIQACKNMSQRRLSLNALQSVGKRAWIWSFGHIPNMKWYLSWLAS